MKGSIFSRQRRKPSDCLTFKEFSAANLPLLTCKYPFLSIRQLTVKMRGQWECYKMKTAVMRSNDDTNNLHGRNNNSKDSDCNSTVSDNNHHIIVHNRKGEINNENVSYNNDSSISNFPSTPKFITEKKSGNDDVEISNLCSSSEIQYLAEQNVNNSKDKDNLHELKYCAETGDSSTDPSQIIESVDVLVGKTASEGEGALTLEHIEEKVGMQKSCNKSPVIPIFKRPKWARRGLRRRSSAAALLDTRNVGRGYFAKEDHLKSIQIDGDDDDDDDWASFFQDPQNDEESNGGNKRMAKEQASINTITQMNETEWKHVYRQILGNDVGGNGDHADSGFLTDMFKKPDVATRIIARVPVKGQEMFTSSCDDIFG